MSGTPKSSSSWVKLLLVPVKLLLAPFVYIAVLTWELYFDPVMDRRKRIADSIWATLSLDERRQFYLLIERESLDEDRSELVRLKKMLASNPPDGKLKEALEIRIRSIEENLQAHRSLESEARDISNERLSLWIETKHDIYSACRGGLELRRIFNKRLERFASGAMHRPWIPGSNTRSDLKSSQRSRTS